MSTTKDDLPTIAALGVIAMCISTVAHEAIGHGVSCVANGAQVTLVSSVYFQCHPTAWFVDAGGPLGNLIWALIAMFVARNLRGAARLLFVLTAMFSLLWEAGYMLYAAVLNEGDYIFSVRGFINPVTPLARVALGVAGAVLYFFALNQARALLRPFATDSARVQALLRTAWVAATAGAMAAAALYVPDRGGAVTQAFLEIGAASAPAMLMRREYSGGDASALRRSVVWIVAALIIFGVFSFTLGRGISA